MSTAEVMQAADANVATTLMSREIDLAVVDIDIEGGLATLRAAKEQVPSVPSVALTANPQLHEQARAAGADEVVSNPPPFAELQVVLVRALSKPSVVRGMAGSPSRRTLAARPPHTVGH
jgi:CheY-like chemotaxis protein